VTFFGRKSVDYQANWGAAFKKGKSVDESSSSFAIMKPNSLMHKVRLEGAGNSSSIVLNSSSSSVNARNYHKRNLEVYINRTLSEGPDHHPPLSSGVSGSKVYNRNKLFGQQSLDFISSGINKAEEPSELYGR
jgi:hypothetical protein